MASVCLLLLCFLCVCLYVDGVVIVFVPVEIIRAVSSLMPHVNSIPAAADERDEMFFFLRLNRNNCFSTISHFCQSV